MQKKKLYALESDPLLVPSIFWNDEGSGLLLYWAVIVSLSVEGDPLP